VILRPTPAHSEGSVWSIVFWVLFALAVVAGLVWLVLAVTGTKRFAQALGKPTPEEARVQSDAIEADTQRRMKEERDASPDRKIHRLRTLRERGRLQRDDK
jgi:hypothetical protein